MSTQFFGKYRAVVTDNRDPMQMGRLKVQVPGVMGMDGSAWAMPCVPLNVPKKIGSALPNVGAGVWIEFEAGDPNRPVWTGCFWTAADTPPALRNG